MLEVLYDPSLKSFHLLFGSYYNTAFLINQAHAHIDLLFSKPLLNGKARSMTALKAPPFGAPNIDITNASVSHFKNGEEIE